MTKQKNHCCCVSFRSANIAGQSRQEEKHACLCHSFSSFSLSLPVCLYCAEAGWLPESPGIWEFWELRSLIHTLGDEPRHRGCVKKGTLWLSMQSAILKYFQKKLQAFKCSRTYLFSAFLSSHTLYSLSYFFPPSFPLCWEAQLSQLLRPCNRHSWKDSVAMPVTPLDCLYQSFRRTDSVIREQMAYQKAPVLASSYTFNAHLNVTHDHGPGNAVIPLKAAMSIFGLLNCI